jgi:hypothetical protein
MAYQTKVYRRQSGNALVAEHPAGRVIVNAAVTNLTTAGDETYTSAQIAGVVITRDPNGAGRTDTTDTAANLITALGLEENGECAQCYLINTADAAEAITLAGGVGVTVLNAGQTVRQNKAALLLFRRTGAAAVTLYIIGSNNAA